MGRCVVATAGAAPLGLARLLTLRPLGGGRGPGEERNGRAQSPKAPQPQDDARGCRREVRDTITRRLRNSGVWMGSVVVNV